jgi:outer membrane protein assembly factor BamB
MKNKQTIELAGKTAVVALIFTALVSILMLIGYFQLRAQDPLELESLQALEERLKDEPNNDELRDEIRNLDLLARKAFFTSQWQVRAGRYLLLIGGIVLVFSLRVYYTAEIRIGKPGLPGIPDIRNKSLSRRWVVVAGVLVLVAAVTASFGVTDYLSRYDLAGTPEPASGQDGSIEVIRVSDGQDRKGLSGTVEKDSDLLSAAAVEKVPADEHPAGKQARPVREESTATGKAVGEQQTEETGQAGSRAGFIKELLKNHNGFRGPFGNGISYRKNIPTDWDGPTGKNIRWKTLLSKPGYNSPIVWGNNLFLAGADGTGQVVYCLDINTGEITWQKEIRGIPGSPSTPPKVSDDTGLSAPTMTTDGTRAYALFGTGDLAALKTDGSVAWERNLGVPDNHYGHASSLIIWNNRLLIQYDSNTGGRILSLDASTGKTQWDKKRNAGISWASPILAEIGGRYEVVLASAPIVAAYDPETGNEVWSYECLMGEVGPSPAFGDGLVFAANEYARLVAIKPGTSPTAAWEDDEYLPEVASPVIGDGLLFIATSYGVLVCYDAATGEKYWEDELNQGFYASPMVADGKLYALDVNGIMHIYKLTREMQKLGEPALGERTVATPAFSPGRIYIRGNKNLYCIGQE